MNKEKKITLYSVIGAICCIICALLYSSRFDFDLARFGWRAQREATVQIIVFLMIAILLFFRKKNIIWIIPFVAQIWLWKSTYSGYFGSNAICPAMLKISIVCLLLAYVTMLLILLCNTISAFEKAAMRINKFIWFIPAILMFIGFGVQNGRVLVYQVISYLKLGIPIFFKIYGVQPLVEALILLCIGIWIKNIYQEPKSSKVHISQHKHKKEESSYTIPNYTAPVMQTEKSERSNAMENEEIMKVVKPAICNQLKSPASAQFPAELLSVVGDDERGYQVSGFVDSQNSYGAMIRNDFTANVGIENGFPVVKSASVGKKANAARAKQFGANYILISIFTIIIAAVSYFIIKSMIGF